MIFRDKKISILILLFVLVVGFLIYKSTKKTSESLNNSPQIGEDKTFVFQCAGGKSLTAIFHTPDSAVDLVLSDGREMHIPKALSASGARYANSNETFVFWNKGNTAFITEGSKAQETYSKCVTK